MYILTAVLLNHCYVLRIGVVRNLNYTYCNHM